MSCEKWWLQYYDGPEKYGCHPSHGLGMPARIAYCMLRDGQWNGRQVIPNEEYLRRACAAVLREAAPINH